MKQNRKVCKTYSLILAKYITGKYYNYVENLNHYSNYVIVSTFLHTQVNLTPQMNNMHLTSTYHHAITAKSSYYQTPKLEQHIF